MDVQKVLCAVFFSLALSACDKKSVATVFPEGNSSQDLSSCSGQTLANRYIVEWEDGHFTVENYGDVESFKSQFVKPQLSKIKYIEKDRLIQLSTQNSNVETSATIDNYGQQITEVEAAYAQGFYGQNVKMAVVDSYIDTSHPQLFNRVLVNTSEIPNNGIDDDRNGVIDDDRLANFSSGANTGTPSSHGTHVSGVMVADPQFGPIRGIAPAAQLIATQFIGNDGSGSLGDAIRAIQYAVSRGARVINASWGGAPCVSSLQNAFASLATTDTLIVVAAGNDGRDIDAYPEYPASFNLANQITVAASSSFDFMTPWSNAGLISVHLAAPGDRILSTVPGNATAYMDGTSMAAPFVTGAAALLWSARPQATAAQIKEALIASVDVKSGREFRVKSRGRMNIRKALSYLTQKVP